MAINENLESSEPTEPTPRVPQRESGQRRRQNQRGKVISDEFPDRTDSVWRPILSLCAILLSPFAVFLCGFCCCSAVMHFEGSADRYGFPGEYASAGFFLGLLAGVVLIVLFFRWAFRGPDAKSSPPSETDSDDATA